MHPSSGNITNRVNNSTLWPESIFLTCKSYCIPYRDDLYKEKLTIAKMQKNSIIQINCYFHCPFIESTWKALSLNKLTMMFLGRNTQATTFIDV